MEADTLHWFILIAVIFTELFLFFFIIKIYSGAKIKFIDPESFKEQLEKEANRFSSESIDETDLNYGDQNELAEELIDLMVNQYSIKDIKLSIHSYLTKPVEEIKSIANLGPVVGLIGTFLGILLTVVDLPIFTGTENNLLAYQKLSSLYPVFIGGISGIFVYGVGTWLSYKLHKYAVNYGHSYFNLFREYVRETEYIKPRTLEQVLKQLIKPIRRLIMNLNEIDKEFIKLKMI